MKEAAKGPDRSYIHRNVRPRSLHSGWKGFDYNIFEEATAQLLQRLNCDQKVADSLFDFRTGYACLSL